MKSSVVAKITRFQRVRTSAYISFDVRLYGHAMELWCTSRLRSCAPFFISLCLKVGLINDAWESFILDVGCVFMTRPFSHKFMVKFLSEFNKIIDKIMASAMT